MSDRGISFYTPSSKNGTAKPSASPAQSLLPRGHSWDCGRRKIFSCDLDTLKRLLSWILTFKFPFKYSVTKDGCPLRSSSRKLALPPLNNLHHFLALNSYIAPSSYTAIILLWISLGRKDLTFKSFTIRRTSPMAGFLISFSFSITTANG